MCLRFAMDKGWSALTCERCEVEEPEAFVAYPLRDAMEASRVYDGRRHISPDDESFCVARDL